MYEQNMKQAFMRGVCALNLEAMTMFRQHDATGYHGNGLAPSTGEGGHSEGEESDHPSLDLAHPPQRHTSHLPPSESAPSTHHHGDLTHPLPRPHLPSSVSAPPTHSHGNQPSHLTPLPHPSSQSGHVTASSVQVRTSQPRTKATTRGQSSVGVASHRRGRGRPRPAVMVERHTLEQ